MSGTSPTTLSIAQSFNLTCHHQEAASNSVAISGDDMSEECFDWIIRWLYEGGGCSTDSS